MTTIYVHSVRDYVLTGHFPDGADIRISDVQNLTVRNVTGKDISIRLAGVKNQRWRNCEWTGGLIDSFASPLAFSRFGDLRAWAASNNGPTQVIGSKDGWKLSIPTATSTITLPIDKAEVKNGGFEGWERGYLGAHWVIRDGAGIEHSVKCEFFGEENGVLVAKLRSLAILAPGNGFWWCSNPSFINRIDIQGLKISGHAYAAFYYSDVSIKDSEFGPSTLDYNVGFEFCRNVELERVKAWGNQTTQAGGASVGLLFGVEELTVKASEIDRFGLASRGRKVGSVESNVPIKIAPDGWYVESVTAGL